MSISSTYRALPDACIEKARKYLALLETPPNLHQLDDLDIRGIFIIPDDMSFNVGCIPITWKSDASPFDHNDPCDLSLVGPKEQTKPGTTVVHAERVVVDDKKMIKILKFENVVLRFDLPHEYFSSQPCCWKYREGVEIKYYDAPHTIHQSVLPCDILSIKEFGKMIKTMKEAGVRLSKINKTAKLEREHSGKFMVSI